MVLSLCPVCGIELTPLVCYPELGQGSCLGCGRIWELELNKKEVKSDGKSSEEERKGQ